MSHDEATLGFYAAEAETYAAHDADRRYHALEAFMAALPAGAAVLELGCGAGRDSALMLARGFDVTPTDGAPAMAREAERRLGRPVKVLLFADLDDEDRYDGVWASASLLHAPRAGLPGIIGLIHAALRPGGRFFASYKSGAGEGRDGFGRYYNYPSVDELRAIYAVAPWVTVQIEALKGGGYDGRPTDWLHVTAARAADRPSRSSPRRSAPRSAPRPSAAGRRPGTG
jgi:SAM-dependent methyltransferase